MRILVDTNLLFYALNKDAPEHSKASCYLERLWNSGERWCLSWTNVYELLKLLTHPGVLSRPLPASEAWAAVANILDHPRLELLVEGEFHNRALREILEAVTGARGGFFHDCRIAAILREHDVRAIATADTDFRKFAFLEVIDPIRG